MWDARTKTLYMQVGIGSGNRRGTFHGDHDLWRLPKVRRRFCSWQTDEPALDMTGAAIIAAAAQQGIRR